MTEFTDGTAKGKTLSLVELEKRLEELKEKFTASQTVKRIPVSTPNNYVDCIAYQVGKVVTVFGNISNYPKDNVALVTGLPKPTNPFYADFLFHSQRYQVRMRLEMNGVLYNHYSIFNGTPTSGNEGTYSFFYIAQEE